jgi:hypothetical protein
VDHPDTYQAMVRLASAFRSGGLGEAKELDIQVLD